MTHEQGYYAETRTLCCTVRYEGRWLDVDQL